MQTCVYHWVRDEKEAFSRWKRLSESARLTVPADSRNRIALERLRPAHVALSLPRRDNMLTSLRMVALACMSVLSIGAAYAADPMVNESAREIPVAYDVDVVVVGGQHRGGVGGGGGGRGGGQGLPGRAASLPGRRHDGHPAAVARRGRDARPRRWPERSFARCRQPAATARSQPRCHFTYEADLPSRRQARRHPRAQAG